MSPEKMGIVERFYRTCGDAELESNQNFNLNERGFIIGEYPLLMPNPKLGH